jgi:hypothetical protein
MLMCNSTMDSEDLVEVCLNFKKNNLIDSTTNDSKFQG